MRTYRTVYSQLFALIALCALIAGCAAYTQPYSTQRDKTAKGAGIGALAGAVAAVAAGEEEADEILAGAAIGAVLGAGVGAYMDRQEERLTQIPGTTVERVAEDVLLVTFGSDVLFALDSAALSGAAQATLEQVSGVLLEFDKTAVVVQGFTDSTGSEAYNLDLSQRRATAVANYLIARGVTPARITAIGHGESMPVASNETASGRQLNRRVTILLKANVQ